MWQPFYTSLNFYHKIRPEPVIFGTLIRNTLPT
jgi:hypothetical protein